MMPDRNEQHRREARYRSALLHEDEHPFLTPHGYRLQQQRVGSSPAIPLPRYVDPPPGGQPRDRFDAGQSVEVDPNAWKQNVAPARKFPDPSTLKRMPLTAYFRSNVIANPGRSALRAIGKLLIHITDDPSKGPASGSAWVAGPDLIVTSAHNLFDSNTRRWAHRVEFHPSYNYYDPAEQPVCRVVSCSIPGGYFQNPTTNHDLAFCRVDKNIGDLLDVTIPLRPVGDLDLFETARVHICGYPAGSRFDFGKQLWRSTGDLLFGQRSGAHDDFGPVMATDFGAGASGCPWVIQESGQLKAVGVTSGHARLGYQQDEPNLMSLTSPLLTKDRIRPDADDLQTYRFAS